MFAEALLEQLELTYGTLYLKFNQTCHLPVDPQWTPFKQRPLILANRQQDLLQLVLSGWHPKSMSVELLKKLCSSAPEWSVMCSFWKNIHTAPTSLCVHTYFYTPLYSHLKTCMFPHVKAEWEQCPTELLYTVNAVCVVPVEGSHIVSQCVLFISSWAVVVIHSFRKNFPGFLLEVWYTHAPRHHCPLQHQNHSVDQRLPVRHSEVVTVGVWW